MFGDTQWPNATRTFEVDARGQAIAELITPGTWRNYRNGAWRAIPFDSVCGETADCPAEMSDEQCAASLRVGADITGEGQSRRIQGLKGRLALRRTFT